MRSLKDETRRLIAELYDEPATSRWLGHGDKRRRQVLTQIATTGDVMAVPFLLSFLLRSTTVDDATAAIACLLESASEKEVLYLHEIRGFGSVYSYSADRYQEWAVLSPDQLAEFDCGAAQSVWVLGLASFHRNGYVREAAVKRLARRSEPQVLPFLLLRANDWVPQVRIRAQTALTAKLCAGPIAHFARALPYLARLSLGQRDNHAPFIRQVHDGLASEPGLEGLAQATTSLDRYVRRAAFELVWTRDDRTVQEFLDTALRDDDVLVRIKAAQRALSTARRTRWIRRLGSDRAAVVRRVLVDHLGDRSTSVKESLIPFLLDPNLTVRRDARFYLNTLGWNDFAEYYREAVECTQEHLLRPAILGLGETGSANDVRRVQPHLRAPACGIRRAAVAALDRLCATASTDLFLEALQDPAPSVSRAAREALLKGRRPVSLDTLAALVKSSASGHVRRNAVRLLLNGSHWSSIRYLVDVAQTTDGELRRYALEAIDRWLARRWRIFVTPSRSEVSQLRSSLAAYPSQLEGREVLILEALRDRSR